MEAEGKTQAIVCTPEHPFFVDGKGWVEAGSLGIGTSIVTRAGPTLAVKSLDWKRSAHHAGAGTPAFTVYNFTVDASHTFFVGTANGGAWTHNSTCDLDALSQAAAKPDRNWFTRAGRALQKHGFRANDPFSLPATRTAGAYNQAGQDAVDDILTHPGTTMKANPMGGYDFKAPDGRGLRFDDNGDLFSFRR